MSFVIPVLIEINMMLPVYSAWCQGDIRLLSKQVNEEWI